jgi:beta-galactosidase
MWRIQPATTPDQLPAEEAWGTVEKENWVGFNYAPEYPLSGVKRGKEWADIDPDSVNSLWYEQDMEIPASWRGSRVIVDIERVDGDAIIFWNDERVGELLLPAGQFDVTDAVDWGGENYLRIFVTRDYSGISRPFEQDKLKYLSRNTKRLSIPMKNWSYGITGEVKVCRRPAEAITDVFCITSWREKTLDLEVTLELNEPLSNPVLSVDILDEDGRTALSFERQLSPLEAGSATQTVSSVWTDPIPWELEAPYLYTARVSLKDGDRLLDVYPPVRFGFREVWTEGRQLMLNGHPSRWRLTDVYGVSAPGLSLYRLMGYNVGQIQPHPQLWWQNRKETPLLDEELLNAMDELGMGCTAPAPGVSYLPPAALYSPSTREQYMDEARTYLRRYRNHPSILAWAVTMNSYNPHVAISPEGMGVREKSGGPLASRVNAACDIMHELDPTRLAYGHADGNTGDISSANVYLNFVPLQEREEWPMAWAAQGDMPYSAVEMGPPYSHNFWKTKQFLLPEFAAIYFGPEAYLSSSEEGLREIVSLSGKSQADLSFAGDARNVVWRELDLDQFPIYWDFMDLFVGHTNRAWRTWGVNAGWMYWLIGRGYGSPTDYVLSGKPHLDRYKGIDEPLTRKPDWAEPTFDTFSQANHPLLAYIGGDPVPTDKTHAFYAGEAFTKNVVLVWDGPGACSLDVTWALKQGEKTWESGSKEVMLEAGDIKLVPLQLQAPKQAKHRTALTLEVTITDSAGTTVEDAFDCQVFPRLAPVQAAVKLYDPAHKSADALEQIGVTAEPWQAGEPLTVDDVLIIGREALRLGDQLPYTPEDIANGVKVLVMAQQPEVWEGMGFNTIEVMPRYCFINDETSPVLAGLSAEDLINWRGSPDLLPEGKQAREYDVQHAPKWTNRHAVASVALEIPTTVGFTPVLKTEFNLGYSPLLQWSYGKGVVFFSSLDLSQRLGSDPAASLLAANLLQVLRTPVKAPAREAVYIGDDVGKELLESINANFRTAVALPEAGSASVVILSPKAKISAEQAEAFAQAGGTVLYLPRNAEQLTAAGFSSHETEVIRVAGGEDSGLLRAIGPELLQWRDSIELTLLDAKGQPANTQAVADGLLARQTQGKGAVVLLQVEPADLSQRYADEPLKKEAVQLSVQALYRLVAQVLTNLGAESSEAVAERLSFVLMPPRYQDLVDWRVLGPWVSEEKSGADALNFVFQGETDALTGAENPNVQYKLPDGRTLTWSNSVTVDKNNFVNMGKTMGFGAGTVGYAVKGLQSPVDRTAELRLGFDYLGKVWVNGEEVLVVDQPHGAPAAKHFQVQVPLMKGKNVLTVKVESGTKGLGFWADIATAPESDGNSGGAHASAHPQVSLYVPLFKPFDPYKFRYW